MADNSLQNGSDTIRDKDRSGVKTQIFGIDLTIGGASETLMNGAMPVIGPDTAGNPIATTKPLVIGAVGVSAAPTDVDSGDLVHLTADLKGRLAVCDMGGSITVDNAGTFAVQAAGDVAHDGADSGNPVKVGMKAIAYAAQTAVAAGDRHDMVCDRHGSQFVIGGHPDVVTLEAATTAAQTDVALVTVSAGTKIVVTQIQVVTDNANTAFPQIRVGFGATNTPTTTGVVLTHPGLPAGGGVSRGDGGGILGVGADGEDLRVTNAVPTGGSLRVLITYYTIPS